MYSEKSPLSADVFATLAVRMESVVGKPLSPESIDTYADDALDSLIDFVDDATSEYNRQPTIQMHDTQDTEAAAFSYFHLGDVGGTLDLIAAKAEEIKHLRDVIGRAIVTESVIIPPDSIQPQLHAGEGKKFEAKLTIERLKTILFILSNDFDINVDDPTQLGIIKGVVTEQMIRKSSYYTLAVPNLDKTVLVCDEEGNATYVFNTSGLIQRGIATADVSDARKSELNELIEHDPKLGNRITYSSQFVPEVIAALQDTADTQNMTDSGSELGTVGNYLTPPPPEGYRSIQGMAKNLGIGDPSIIKAIEALGANLGDIGVYKFYAKRVTGYSPEQQILIEQYLTDTNKLVATAPENFLSVLGMANKFNTGSRTIVKALKELGGSIGDTSLYRFGPQRTTGYSPAQQEQLRPLLEKYGAFLETAPPEIRSTKGIAKELNLSSTTVRKVLRIIQAEIGDANRYKFANSPATGYTKEQQAVIRQALKDRGLLTPDAPADVKAADSFARSQNASYESVVEAIQALGPKLGRVDTYKFSSIITAGYNEEQQRLIAAYLAQKD